MSYTLHAPRLWLENVPELLVQVNAGLVDSLSGLTGPSESLFLSETEKRLWQPDSPLPEYS